MSAGSIAIASNHNLWEHYHVVSKRDWDARTCRRADGDDERTGWSADLVSIHMAALSRRHAREYEGLWMKEPQEFLFDPLARARRDLQKFPAPPPVRAAAG